MFEQPSSSRIKSRLLDAIIEKKNSFSTNELRMEELRDSSMRNSLMEKKLKKIIYLLFFSFSIEESRIVESSNSWMKFEKQNLFFFVFHRGVAHRGVAVAQLLDASLLDEKQKIFFVFHRGVAH